MKHSKRLHQNHFAFYNAMFFDNKLPMPEFSSFKSKAFRGWFQGIKWDDADSDILIKIENKHYNQDYTEYCETLLHEMVHLMQFHYGLKVNHGKSFKVAAKKIEKTLGLRIR
jgi:hypothetical protein